VVKDAQGNVVTDEFAVKTQSGTLTIAPAAVTITVANDSKVYGTLDPKFESPTVEGLIEDKDLGTITVVRTNSSEETAGTYEDVLDVTYTQNNNYTVTVNKGDFTITQQTIDPEDPSNIGVTVNSPSDYEYDGNAHQWKPDVTDKDNNLLDEGTDYIVSYDKDDFTNVTGIITVTIEGTGNYTGTVTRTYQITPRPVTLTSGSASKTYDGTALTNSEVTITSGSLVNASDVTYAAVGSITNAGSTANTIEVGYANAQMDANYDVRVVEGTLTVYAQSIDPEDPHDPDPEDPEQPVYMGVDTNSPSNVVYDGAAHQWLPTVTAEDGTVLVLGTDYNVTYSTTDFTNVTGEIVVTITGAGNYAGEITRTYQITPRPVTLTSGSASKTYDGTALTNSEVTITSGSLVNASDVTYAAVGSITNVGSSLNRISVSYASEQMARNYVVTLVEGTLTVNTAPTTPPTTPTTPPTTPGTPGTTTDDGATTDEPEVEEVEDEETPLSDGDVEDVEDNATPKGNNGIWALINLIAAIVTVILGLILLLSKRHRNDEEEDEEERQARIERGEEKEQEQKRGWICKVLGVIVAIASVVFFILTEDMSLPMALTDKWTIWMIVIAIVELVLVLVGRHWKDVDDEDQEQQA
ncbi:FILTED domain-containing surface protein, partial [Faecalitalea cylindroides]|uniref:MBG domain-containing protein n=1 Tax=Faecalitalea cylindroides TaxID=39483 RepID=UPI00226C4F37